VSVVKLLESNQKLKTLTQ